MLLTTGCRKPEERFWGKGGEVREFIFDMLTLMKNVEVLRFIFSSGLYNFQEI